MDLAHTVPNVGRFRVNVFSARARWGSCSAGSPIASRPSRSCTCPRCSRAAMERRGMILVTGITGSGKSTTLAAMIDHINRTRNEHIVTIEDPIEFMHEDKHCVINQREVGQDSTSFAQALRAALRRTRTSSSSARCATPRRWTWRCTPPRRATSCSRRFIRWTRPRRSTASSRSSRPTRRTRSASALCRPQGRHLPAPGRPRRRQGARARSRSHGGYRPHP